LYYSFKENMIIWFIEQEGVIKWLKKRMTKKKKED
jgi:hypothetical protein